MEKLDKNQKYYKTISSKEESMHNKHDKCNYNF